MNDTTNGRQETARESTNNNGPVVQLPVDLRDYFAAKAMQGLLAGSGGVIWADLHDLQIDVLVKKSLLIADAMLSARKCYARPAAAEVRNG